MGNLLQNRLKITSTSLLLATVAFMILAENRTFFGLTLEAYPLTLLNTLRLATLALLLGSVMTLLFAPLCYRRTLKPVLVLLLMLSATLTYFMETYGVVIDDVMIDSILRTDVRESSDLFSLRFVLYVLLLGVIPSLLVILVPVHYRGLRRELFAKLKVLSGSLALITLVLFSFGDFYASFFREQKPLRYYINPAYFLYSAGYYIADHLPRETPAFVNVGSDARKSPGERERELVILVVGETVRADHFSLNGYTRQTNPLLQQESVTSFTNTWSCGTTTAISVPCMFSLLSRDDFELNDFPYSDNLLDVIQRTGTHILWRENNSDSKSVAVRVPYEDYRTPELNPVCDEECRDVGMLDGLQEYIDSKPDGDILVIMHQMGNHGPAYYKRYPEEFAKFQPTCKTNQLEQCSREEINNAYDNAILYSDYFLSRIIQLLKANDARFRTAMLYASDHGESLGENNLFLHGLPYFMAPDEQKHVAMLLWLGEKFQPRYGDIIRRPERINGQYSHDNLSHTLLGLLEIETTVYDQDLDILNRRIDSSASQGDSSAF